MNITVETYGQAVILNFKGDLTADSLEAFKKTTEHHLADNSVRDLVLNLEAVTFVDSAVLEHLLELQEKLNERLGQIKIVRPDANVAKILEVTRLETAFERFEDVSEAVKTL